MPIVSQFARATLAVAWTLVLPAAGIACGQSTPHAQHHDFLPADGDSARRIEYFWSAPPGAGPWPAVILIHGHQEGRATPGGMAFVGFGVLDSLARRGYVAVAVSQPGYGRSDGPADFMGPRTVAAVEAVIRQLRRQPFIRGDRIALEGISRGAIVASLVAARDTTIRALVLISGSYDFTNPPDSSTAAGRLDIARRSRVASSIATETDGTVEALRARSALSVVDRIRTPALIMNGAKDDRTDPEQARRLAEGMRRRGIPARDTIYGAYGHAIPYDVREVMIRPFLDSLLR
jgi:dipeptidyl aminopeptidase/acylaminoacyl peptidase